MSQFREQLAKIDINQLTEKPKMADTQQPFTNGAARRPRNHNRRGRDLPAIGTVITMPVGAVVRPSYEHKTVRVIKDGEGWSVITDPNVRGGLIVFINGDIDLEKQGTLTVTKHTYSGSSVWANLQYENQ